MWTQAIDPTSGQVMLHTDSRLDEDEMLALVGAIDLFGDDEPLTIDFSHGPPAPEAWPVGLVHALAERRGTLTFWYGQREAFGQREASVDSASAPAPEAAH